MTSSPVTLRSRLASAAIDLVVAVEAFFVRHRDRLPWVHAGMFVLFLTLLLVPPITGLPAEDAGPFDNFRLFSNMLLWGLWFPLVFVSVVFTGRSWCGLLCPMGAVSGWANRKGLQRAIPGWLRWPGTPVVSFVAVTIWAQTLGARDHAESATILFGSTMLPTPRLNHWLVTQVDTAARM